MTNVITTKYLIFTRDVSLEQAKKVKTQIWQVESKGGDFLGEIKWFATWRQYCFFTPDPDLYRAVVLAQSCLDDISNLISTLMAERAVEQHIAAEA